MNAFRFQTRQVEKKTRIFGQKVGCNKKRFFNNLCFANSEKLSFFGGGQYFANIWLLFTKYYKNRYFSTFLEAKKATKHASFKGYLGGQVKVISEATLGAA